MDILGFRAPSLPAANLVALAALEKNASAAKPASGRLQIGSVRALDKAARVEQWQPVAGGYVAKLRVSAQGAEGLRVKLALGAVPGAIDVRVRGNEDRVEGMTIVDNPEKVVAHVAHPTREEEPVAAEAAAGAEATEPEVLKKGKAATEGEEGEEAEKGEKKPEKKEKDKEK